MFDNTFLEKKEKSSSRTFLSFSLFSFHECKFSIMFIVMIGIMLGCNLKKYK